METIDNRTLKEKVAALKFKAGEKVKQVKDWVKENPQMAFTAGSVIIGSASYIGKKAFRIVENKQAMKAVECRHYDPRTGENWFTRRPLNSKEQLQLDKLYKSGLSKGEILESMRLLK